MEYISEAEEAGKSCASTPPPTTTFFPSLKELTIEFRGKLKGWWKINDNEDDEVTTIKEKAELLSFPSLYKLEIVGCSMLTCMPMYPTLNNLYLFELSMKTLQQTLRMKMKTSADAAEELSASFSARYSALARTNLKSLSLIVVNDLKSLPELLQRVLRWKWIFHTAQD